MKIKEKISLVAKARKYNTLFIKYSSLMEKYVKAIEDYNECLMEKVSLLEKSKELATLVKEYKKKESEQEEGKLNVKNSSKRV